MTGDSDSLKSLKRKVVLRIDGRRLRLRASYSDSGRHQRLLPFSDGTDATPCTCIAINVHPGRTGRGRGTVLDFASTGVLPPLA